LQKKYLIIVFKWIGPPNLQPKINSLISDLGLQIKLQQSSGKGLLRFGGKITAYDGEVSTSVEGFDKYNEIIRRLDIITDRVSLDEHMETKFPGIFEITIFCNNNQILETEEFTNYSTPNEWFNQQLGLPEDKNTKAMFEGSIRW
jgi:hypothetical protein